MNQAFHDAMAQGYALNEPAIPIGSPLDGEAALGEAALGDVRVQVSLGVLNRHGLIAGATGTARRRRSSSWPASCQRPACRSS